MGEMTSEGANLGAGIDLSQFYQVFFEEAGENLDRLEQQLLEINIESADDEDGSAVVEEAPSNPNPVTQDEMDAGSIELF